MVVTDTDVFPADVLIEDGIVRQVADEIDDVRPDDTLIDAQGKFVLPGAVDVHTHMDLDVGFTRAIDDFYTGTVAAACGGTRRDASDRRSGGHHELQGVPDL